ncbi:ATP-dependent DNA helicase Q1 [Paramuricea clavata]|uniref:ATP-dependent DNA helicase Q1 n=1 Tax=Paramuricea clavata TaxID=317549 RepID=A0A6S7FJ55_PARCT|nr:ATP-dependent DNA helicase Q1 [Paramuricea clavata]
MKGQAAFHEAFGKVSELRSIIEDGTPVLGLTATANPEMRGRLMKYLCMKSGTAQIVVSPNRNNIRFSVFKADAQLSCFEWIVSMIQEKKEETPYTIISCKTVNDIVLVLNFFLSQLGQSVYVDGSEPPQERSLLGVYYSQTPKNAKDKITSSFECIKGNI